MSQPNIRIFPDAEAVSRGASEEFVRCAREAVAARGRFIVTLSGGSTPKRMFEMLAEPPSREQVEWSKVHIFWGDERSVPPDNRDSNYRMAHEAMLTRLPIPVAQIYRIEAERSDRDAAARDYQVRIAKTFGVDPAGEPPAFDLVLLGMGPDGHTASLFPQTTALSETKRWVVVNFVPKFNTDRVTLTTPILNKARQVLFLVAGADKTQPLAEVIEGPPDPTRLPSQLIKPSPGELVWFVDRLAAAKLTPAGGDIR
jgi:6-phosphogluconolactonase